MVSKIRIIFALSAVFVFLACGLAAADENHYVNHLIGDRASGMGGAYTGISDDVSGLYYNPAGIMYSTGRNLSASVNAYFYETKKYDNVIGGNGWERESKALLPNFFGITQPVGNFRFGFSYAVPDSIQEDQDQTFFDVPSSTPGLLVKEYVINFNNDDNTYQFGPSFAADINKDMAIGLTLYFHQRKNQMILNQFLVKNTAPESFEWTNRYHELNEWGFRPILGFMWSPAEKLSIGLALSKVLVKRSTFQTQDTSATFDSSGGESTRTVVDSDAKRKYPLQLRAGAAYFFSSSLLVDADVTYSQKVNDVTFGNKVSVVNAAVGTEYYYSKNVAIRAGLFTDLANTPEVVAEKTGQDEHINIYGGSASISTFTKNTSITFGASYTQGRGEAQLISDSSAIQGVNSTGWTIFVSSSYSY